MPEKNEFVVNLDGIKLSAAQKSRINGAIQAAVLAELGGFDSGGDRFAHLPWKEWYGLIMREKMFDAMPKAPTVRW
jgi:hypothetical protein